jgi:transcriptional regulator with XRE-family HTH domain
VADHAIATAPTAVRQLATLRRAAGLTQAEVAARLGTSQSAVSELEGGRASPTLALLERYAALFGMRVVLTVADGS